MSKYRGKRLKLHHGHDWSSRAYCSVGNRDSSGKPSNKPSGLDWHQAYGLIRTSKTADKLQHGLSSSQDSTFVPGRINTWRDKSHIFRHSYMGNLFQMRRQFIYVGTPVGAMDSIFTQRQKMLSFLWIKSPPLNSCSLRLWVMNWLAHMLGSLPRNHSHHCLQPCCCPICIEWYILQNSPV